MRMETTSAMTVVISTFRLFRLPGSPLLPKSLGILFVTGRVCVAPSKNTLDKNRARPGPIRFIAIPQTVWSALQVTEAKAWISPKTAPARPAQTKPSQGFPEKYPTAAPIKAPIVIIPSIPMLTTPETSEMTLPCAANTMGVEYMRVMPRRSRNVSDDIVSFLSLFSLVYSSFIAPDPQLPSQDTR